MSGSRHTARSLVQVPPGVQCFVGDEARRRRAIEATVCGVFEGWGYEEIIPPLFDYADVFASTPHLADRTYTFVGRDGALLALRPDFTSLLAKVAAGRLADRTAPLRLYYSGEVLRYEPPQAGRQSELYQMGVEHLGGDARRADAEVVAMAAECLDALDVPGYVLTLGHVGVLHGLIEGAGLALPVVDALRDRVQAKDAPGVQDVLRGSPGAARADAVARLLACGPDLGGLEEARHAVAAWPRAVEAVDELDGLRQALESAGLGGRVSLDLADVRGLEYYTGLVFRAYARGYGFELGSGGRYDGLTARYGRPLASVGFMLGLDRLAALLEGQETGEPEKGVTDVARESLGAALAEAREKRRRGVRVRLT